MLPPYYTNTFFWLCPAIIAGIYSIVNLLLYAYNKKSQNLISKLSIFIRSALAGFIVGLIVLVGLQLPFFKVLTKLILVIYGAFFFVGLMVGIYELLKTGKRNKLINAIKIFAGSFYINQSEHNVFIQLMQAISRFSWELLQTITGHAYCQFKNAFSTIHRVEFFDGVTFIVRENGNGSGISLGNFIEVQPFGKFTSVAQEVLLMHEYGHTFDSRIFGVFYLPIPGLASLLSAYKNVYNNATGISTHDVFWTELRANRFAAKYFKKYGLQWSRFDEPSMNGYWPRT